jgi:hypothetical protein
MFRVDRRQAGDGSWMSEDVDITAGARFVVDFATMA